MRDVKSILGEFPSYMLPRYVTHTGKVIINTDRHTEKVSHWLAIHSLPKSQCNYFFDSYGILPLVPDIIAFIERNCTVWNYDGRHLQGLTSNVYSPSTLTGGVTPPPNLSDYLMARQQTDSSIGPSRPNSREDSRAKAVVNATSAFYKKQVINLVSSFSNIMSNDLKVLIELNFLRGLQNEIVVKEFSVVAKNISESFRLKIPYSMTSHGSE